MNAVHRVAQIIHDNPGISTEEVGDLMPCPRNTTRQALHVLARRKVLGRWRWDDTRNRSRGRTFYWRFM